MLFEFKKKKKKIIIHHSLTRSNKVKLTEHGSVKRRRCQNSGKARAPGWKHGGGTAESGNTYGRCGRRYCFTSSPFFSSPPASSSPEPSFLITATAPTFHTPLASLLLLPLTTMDLAGPNLPSTVSSSSFSMLSGTHTCTLHHSLRFIHHFVMLCYAFYISDLISLLLAPSSQVEFAISVIPTIFQICYIVNFIVCVLCCRIKSVDG